LNPQKNEFIFLQKKMKIEEFLLLNRK